MTIAEILTEIDSQIARLQEVQKLLSNTSGVVRAGFPANGSTSVTKTHRKKRTLSAEARQKIAEAQRKRGAALKRAAK